MGCLLQDEFGAWKDKTFRSSNNIEIVLHEVIFFSFSKSVDAPWCTVASAVTKPKVMVCTMHRNFAYIMPLIRLGCLLQNNFGAGALI